MQYKVFNENRFKNRLIKKSNNIYNDYTLYEYDDSGCLIKEKNYSNKGDLFSLKNYYNNNLGLPEVAELEQKDGKSKHYFSYQYDNLNRIVRKYDIHCYYEKKFWSYYSYEYCEDGLYKITNFDYFGNKINLYEYLYDNKLIIKSIHETYMNCKRINIYEYVYINELIVKEISKHFNESNEIVKERNIDYDNKYSENGLLIETNADGDIFKYEYEMKERKINIYDLEDPFVNRPFCKC
jgi:hypothetical protein